MANLLTRAYFSSEVARYNNRLSTLASRLGTESPIYQAEVSKVNYWIPTENIRYNKDGIIQISKPANLSDKMSLQQLRGLKVKQWQVVKSDYDKAYKTAVKELKTVGETPPTLSEYINNMANISENLGALYQHYSDSEVQSKVNHALDILHGQHKSYTELYNVGEVIKGLI